MFDIKAKPTLQIYGKRHRNHTFRRQSVSAKTFSE